MRTFLTAIVLVSCTAGSDTGEIEEPAFGAFGDGGKVSLSDVNVTVIGTADDGLSVPRDLDFNPDVEDELWVVNRDDDSVSIFRGAGTDDQESEHIVDPYAMHFMEEVSSISFGGVTHDASTHRTFGTCHESRNTYNGYSRPNDFMGPTLWSADPAIFGISNPEAIDFLTELFGFYADLGSHLDMLHESPLCMGIAWDTENVYWVFDGTAGNIVRYDFAEDHGVGYDDHSDGIISRFVDTDVSRVEDVASHMVLDQDTGLLYTVDTGNNRITVLDTLSGEKGGRLSPVERGTDYHEWVGTDYSTLISGSDVEGMDLPSGIALVENLLLVTDNQTGSIFAFDLTGELIGTIDLERDEGGLMGIVARSLSDLWVVDALSNEVIRIQE
jgi:hypothetical protein